jgi:class 3 adenylate cyclase/tetratricopeptide (TPR) repeat protein
MALLCTSCGIENPQGQRFCDACGARLAAACPACGAQNRASARFCGECAAPLPGEVHDARYAGGTEATRPAGEEGNGTAQGAPNAQTVAERRLVSVLFADLVGFTPFAEGRDAEEVRETLTRYFDIAGDVIARYGGTVEKFIGDAVMAVWGAPQAREDDAERAVRAALELVDAVAGLGQGITARVGVLTGEAAVTIGATNQGMVAGDLVNTASRLQGVAQSGTVLVGESTMRAASAAIAFEPIGTPVLKGKALPEPAFRAVRVVAERGGKGRSDLLEAPFVGRSGELRLLKELFHTTAREKRPRLVSVIGPAGIGKSRLAWEFLKYVGAVVEPVHWHSGRSPAYGQGISFWALGEMVRGRAGLAETDDEETARARLAATLERFVPDEGERQWLEPALLALLGIGEVPAGGGGELFSAWRTFFERVATTGTVILVFEDLHWADAGLLDFIAHVLEWSRGVPLFIVTLARPELLDKRPDWGAGVRNFASLPLEPLSDSAVREMLAGLAPDLPARARDQIVSRADGVPLYAVETVRMLVSQGRLVEEDGRYRTTGELSKLAVPETLTALIAARLDTLDAVERALVQDAAVLGRSFTPAAVAAVSGQDAAALEERLRSLVRREILELDADPRSPERGQYKFVQALIREVAYNTLARPDRKRRHLAAARFFEGLGNDLVGALANHYLAAHANARNGPEADALAGQARLALVAAGRRAASLGSHEQALAFLEDALSVTDDPADEAPIRELAADAAVEASLGDQGEEHLRRAIEIYRSRQDRPATAQAIADLGAAMVQRYRNLEAIELLEPAAVEFADLEDDPAVMAIGAQIARAYFLLGDTAKALPVIDAMLPAAERAGHVELIADGLITRGSALWWEGMGHQGQGLIAVGEQLANKHNLPRIAFRGYLNRTEFEAHGDPAAGMAASAIGLATARRLGRRPWMVNILVYNRAFCALRTGAWDEIVAELTEEIDNEPDPAQRSPLIAARLPFLALRGESADDELAALVEATEGDTDGLVIGVVANARAWMHVARWELAEARAAFQVAAEPAIQGSSLMAGFAALWAGDVDGARAARGAVKGLAVHGAAVDTRDATLDAGIAVLEGRVDEGLAAYRAVIGKWDELGLPFDRSLTVLTAAAQLGERAAELEPAIEEATATLGRLGAVTLLSHLAPSSAQAHSEGVPSAAG